MGSSNYSKPLVTPGTGIAAATAPDSGALAFGAITGTTAATANTVVTTTTERGLLECMNTTNSDLVLTVAGVTSNLILRAGTAKIYDLQQSLRRIDGGVVVGVYLRPGGAALASGELIVQLI